jgi:hypothetical protein
LTLATAKAARLKHATNVLLVGASLLASTVVAELALRLSVQPSTNSSGTIFGRELPPMRVMPAGYRRSADEGGADPHESYRSIIVDGKALTHSDLFGILQEDPRLAYLPRANAVSTHGWWRSNNLAARHDADTDPANAARRHRVLFFGDSYTQGSRLPQHAPFVAQLRRLRPEVEGLNFGVDGYSSAQAYLRHESLAGSLDFQAAVFTFVPAADLWRDVSVSRYIGEGWKTYKLQPRFRLAQGKLELVASPFTDLAAQLADGPEFRVSRQHLLAHDVFYFPEYEPAALPDRLILARLYRKATSGLKKRAIHAELRSPASEAMQVTAAIVRRFHEETAARSRTFLLVVLPIHADVESYRNSESFRRSWDGMVGHLCNAGVRCLDVMNTLLAAGAADLDYGHDGTHYGPRANLKIAEAIAHAMPSPSRRGGP